MPHFSCTLVSSEGRTRKRDIEAEKRQQIEALFAEGDEKLIRCRRRRFRSWSPRRWLQRSIPYGGFLLFNQELITLLRAGIPFIRGLEIISENMRPTALRQLLEHAARNIRNGTQISEAFSSSAIPFPRIYKATLLAGEKSGHLETLLQKFNTYLAKIHALRRKTINSLTYPAILLLFMLATVLVVTLFVIPKFASFYEDFEARLPALTRFFIDAAHFGKENILWLAGVLLGGFLAVKIIEKARPEIIIFDQLKLRLPFQGKIIRESALAVFARTLAILVSGGIPVPEASQVAVETFANRYLLARMSGVPGRIREGHLLSAVLNEIAIVPPILVEMVRVGESSGNLSAVLDEAADYYERAIDNKINVLISLIQPVIIIVLGLVVALMLISVYLPIFSASRVVQ